MGEVDLKVRSRSARIAKEQNVAIGRCEILNPVRAMAKDAKVKEFVRTVATIDPVIAKATIDEVISVTAEQDIAKGGAGQDIITAIRIPCHQIGGILCEGNHAAIGGNTGVAGSVVSLAAVQSNICAPDHARLPRQPPPISNGRGL